MKINEMFFWSLLLAYENLCRDLAVKELNRDAEYFFYSNLVNAIFTLDSQSFKETFLSELVDEYPILEKVIKRDKYDRFNSDSSHKTQGE